VEIGYVYIAAPSTPFPEASHNVVLILHHVFEHHPTYPCSRHCAYVEGYATTAMYCLTLALVYFPLSFSRHSLDISIDTFIPDHSTLRDMNTEKG